MKLWTQSRIFIYTKKTKTNHLEVGVFLVTSVVVALLKIWIEIYCFWTFT